MSVISTGPNNAIVISGTVHQLLPNAVQIEAGPGVGYYNVYTNSSTTYVGGKPAAGNVITATGTGTAGTSMTATKIQIGTATPAPTTSGNLLSVSGPIVQMKAGGFQVQGGRGIGYINIYTNGSTAYAGAKPYVGESVTVKGTGSLASSLTAVSVTQAGTTAPVVNPTTAPTTAPTSGPVTSTNAGGPDATAFMPSSWGRVRAMQVFDETYNGSVSNSSATADGGRYVAIWGSRPGDESNWNANNPSLQTAYYNALETDPSYTGWGAIGHDLAWWNANHPDWVLYACTSSGAASSNPAYVPGLTTAIPLDIHNPAVVDYQIRTMAAYAHAQGYHALAIDEATFWQADAGAGSGSYGCGIRQNGSWVQRYTGAADPKWQADVIAWVKQAHSLLTTDPTIASYHLKLIVNHPAASLNADEETFLQYVDADLNEDGNTFYGNYVKSASYFVRTTEWAKYAQEHGVAVLTDDNWGSVSVGTPQAEWSVASYLMSNEQAEALYVAQGNQFGTETWRSQYDTNFGAPCGDYYNAGDSSNPNIYYRRFQNAIVVVNGGGSASEVAHLPTNHSYSDLFGRPVSNPLSIPSNNGYVLMTSNGCN